MRRQERREGNGDLYLQSSVQDVLYSDYNIILEINIS